MLEVLQSIALVAATLAAGLLAGLFYTFAMSIMPALRGADDRTYVAVMQRINIAIVNPWLFLILLGTPVLTLLAGALQLPASERAALPWIAAAFALCVAGLVITIAGNIPLNNALESAGPPGPTADLRRDVREVRRRFEAPWVRWNIARAVASTATFGCLCEALVLYGRGHGA